VCREALRLIACARGGPSYLAPAVRAVRPPAAQTASQSLEVADRVGSCASRRCASNPSSVVTEQAPKEAGPSAAPSEPSRTDLREGQPVPQAPPDRQPPPRTELANVVTPEVEARLIKGLAASLGRPVHRHRPRS